MCGVEGCEGAWSALRLLFSSFCSLQCSTAGKTVWPCMLQASVTAVECLCESAMLMVAWTCMLGFHGLFGCICRHTAVPPAPRLCLQLTGHLIGLGTQPCPLVPVRLCRQRLCQTMCAVSLVKFWGRSLCQGLTMIYRQRACASLHVHWAQLYKLPSRC